jgi:hypothetical protein
VAIILIIGQTGRRYQFMWEPILAAAGFQPYLRVHAFGSGEQPVALRLPGPWFDARRILRDREVLPERRQMPIPPEFLDRITANRSLS